MRARRTFLSAPYGDCIDVHRWAEHTSELELEIEAATEREVFLEALDAFVELVDGGGDSVRTERREVELRGDDRESLLVAWLDELAYLSETQRFVPEGVRELNLGDGTLHATLHGHRGKPRDLLKAV